MVHVMEYDFDRCFQNLGTRLFKSLGEAHKLIAKLPLDLDMGFAGFRIVQINKSFYKYNLLADMFDRNADFKKYFSDIAEMVECPKMLEMHLYKSVLYLIMDREKACGFMSLQIDNASDGKVSVELGYGVDKDFRGRGIAMASRQAMDRFIFKNIPEVDVVLHSVSLKNERSIRASKKLPDYYDYKCEPNIMGRTVGKYSLTREAFARIKSKQY